MRINDAITATQVRLIDENGQQVGVVSFETALSHALQKGLDLVEIVAGGDTPVCKIMEYGKYCYQQKKKKNEARKRQKQVTVKEVKLRPNTGDGDYQTKMRKLREFLAQGDRVKVSVWFRGREITHKELGFTLLERVEKDIDSDALVEQRARMEGRQMIMMLVPNKSRRKKDVEAVTTEPLSFDHGNAAVA